MLTPLGQQGQPVAAAAVADLVVAKVELLAALVLPADLAQPAGLQVGQQQRVRRARHHEAPLVDVDLPGEAGAVGGRLAASRAACCPHSGCKSLH